MYALYLFGAFVERLAGRWEMFVVFMVAGICGSAASTWLGNPPLSAGASGAIMGLLGAAAVIAITFKSIPEHVRRVYIFNFIFIAVLQMLYGFFEPNIDNFAHLGGLVGGALIGLLLRPAGIAGRRGTAFHVAGLAMALVAAVSLFNVVRNVQGGGYPAKTPPLVLVSREDPDRGWSVEVPSFWISLVQPERVQYEGPLGEVLLIEPAKAWLACRAATGLRLPGREFAAVHRSSSRARTIRASPCSASAWCSPAAAMTCFSNAKPATRTHSRTCCSGSWRASKSTRARRRKSRSPRSHSSRTGLRRNIVGDSEIRKLGD